jgi:hypothetical protein
MSALPPSWNAVWEGINLHDNWIYAQSVDHDARVIVLHTVFAHAEPWEFSDVVFEEVLVHHFETQGMTTRPPYPSNVLFDIEEEDVAITLERYREFILPKCRYGWPVGGWEDLGALAGLLTAQGHRCYHVHGTVGLDGFVVARGMRVVRRDGRWGCPGRSDL